MDNCGACNISFVSQHTCFILGVLVAFFTTKSNEPSHLVVDGIPDLRSRCVIITVCVSHPDFKWSHHSDLLAFWFVLIDFDTKLGLFVTPNTLDTLICFLWPYDDWHSFDSKTLCCIRTVTTIFFAVRIYFEWIKSTS